MKFVFAKLAADKQIWERMTTESYILCHRFIGVGACVYAAFHQSLHLFFPPSEHSFRLLCMSNAIIDNACVSPRLRALACAGSGGDMMEAGDEKRLRKRGKCHPPVATPHREFNSSWKAGWISSLTICYACKKLRATCSANNAFPLCHPYGMVP